MARIKVFEAEDGKGGAHHQRYAQSPEVWVAAHGDEDGDAHPVYDDGGDGVQVDELLCKDTPRCCLAVERETHAIEESEETAMAAHFPGSITLIPPVEARSENCGRHFGF